MSVIPARDLRFAIILFGFYACVWAPIGWQMGWLVLLATATFTCISIWASVVDIRTFTIPDLASLALALAGLITIVAITPALVISHLATAIIGGGLFWALGTLLWRWKKIEMLGLGDAKLMAALLIWVGPLGAPGGLLLASGSAVVYALLTRTHKIPFGPFLCAGYFVIWVYGPIGG